MNNIAIIFSKNRPMQLTATLESLYRQCKDIDKIDIKVIYKATSDEIDILYSRVQEDFKDVIFIKETKFKNNLLEAIDNKLVILFIVDDCIFTNKFSINEISRILLNDKSAIGFSLRLGENINYCYPVNKNQKIPIMNKICKNILSFNWQKAEYDFAYPLEVSSSIYKVSTISLILSECSYSNPNELENALFFNLRNFLEYKNLLCYNKSRAFCVPANMVQNIYNNRNMNKKEYSFENFIDLYKLGYRININKFDNFNNQACHEETIFEFIN